MKKGYYVEAYRTRTTCRVWNAQKLYDKPMLWGPWKRLKTAKRKAAELRKGRVETIETIGGPFTDHGPAYRGVVIFEVKE